MLYGADAARRGHAALVVDEAGEASADDGSAASDDELDSDESRHVLIACIAESDAEMGFALTVPEVATLSARTI